MLLVPALILPLFLSELHLRHLRNRQHEALQTHLKTARLIYQEAEEAVAEAASTIACRPNRFFGDDGQFLNTLILSERMPLPVDTDMLIVVNAERRVVYRAHAPGLYADQLTESRWIERALGGAPSATTELVDAETLKREGFFTPAKPFNPGLRLLSLTGASPLWHPDGSGVAGAVILRRILRPGESLLFQALAAHLEGAGVALLEKGRLLWRYPEAIETALADPVVAAAVERAVSGDANGVETAPVGLLAEGWAVRVLPVNGDGERPVAALVVGESLAIVGKVRRIALWAVLTMAGVSMILLWIARRILGGNLDVPLKKLRMAARELEDGDFEVSLPVPKNREMGQLTEAFNRMASGLRELDREMNTRLQALEIDNRECRQAMRKCREEATQAATAAEAAHQMLFPGVFRRFRERRLATGRVDGTVLVAVIEDADRLAEALGDRLAEELANAFFRRGHVAIARYDGLFVSLESDRLTAIFGPPKDESRGRAVHPFDAAAAGMEMVRASADMAEILARAVREHYTAIADRLQKLAGPTAEAEPPESLAFAVRVGLHTADADGGREGDRLRMVLTDTGTKANYAARGDAVERAAAVARAASPGGVEVSDATYRRIRGQWRVETASMAFSEASPETLSDDFPDALSDTLSDMTAMQTYRLIRERLPFDNIHPDSPFARGFAASAPALLAELLEKLRLGYREIREIKAIQGRIGISLPYLEHLAGYRGICEARALFAWAVARRADLPERRAEAVMTASLWHGAGLLVDMPGIAFDRVEGLRAALDDDLRRRIDVEAAVTILGDLAQDAQRTVEGNIIALCNRFDHMVFDRTLLGERASETASVREAISLIRIGKRFDAALVDILGALMTPEQAGAAMRRQRESGE